MDDSPDALDTPRLNDFEPDQDSQQFLRKQKRVPARRSAVPSKRMAQRLKTVGIAAGVLVLLAAASLALDRYGERSKRFRIESSDRMELTGNEVITRGQVIEVLGADLARNVFSVPIEERREQLEQLPWVESATVMRVLPNRIRVHIKERTPVAFVQLGSRISLIDVNGVIMDPSAAAKKYSFPVITGIGETEPLSTRAARMKIYERLLRDLDSEGARYSADIEEVDLSDPDDVKVFAKDPNGGVLVHLGDSEFLSRYKRFISNVATWRQSLGRLHSVDLRFGNQVIVNPDGVPEEPAAQEPAQTVPAESEKQAQKPARPVKAKTVAKKPAAKTRPEARWSWKPTD